jgi:dTDP-glucose 4,6-dehydratase
MRILLTGGCGFIGSNLVRYLIRRTDHVVVNCDKLTYAGNVRSLADIEGNSRYQHLHLDIADHDAVGRMIDEVAPDAIMHLAAESHVDRSITGPADFIQTNVVGTFNLLDHSWRYLQTQGSIKRDRFRFLHVSTDEVYGSLGETGQFSELTRYDPHSPYAASKASSDHLARAWRDTYGLPVIVTNCSNNYGPYQHSEKLIPSMIIRCLHEQPLTIYGNGENVRDWLHVQDHIEAMLSALTQGKVGETYNIGGNNERRNIDLVHSICDIMDSQRPRSCAKSHHQLITHVQDRPGHDYRYAIDSTKIRKELGWQPTVRFKDGLHETVRWYLNHQTWWGSV